MPSRHFAKQTAVITGGSRGLGLALATELVKQNANVVLLARDINELSKAQGRLLKLRQGAVHIIRCDVTKKHELQKAFIEAAQKFDKIDLLINNAGSITVGPLETMFRDDYAAQLELHLFAVIEATRLIQPFFENEKSGKRIVNICSMGGRVAVPHMLPYDVSKFALAGFSQGSGAELAQRGISVTTVYPALMRTGSPIQAVFKGDHAKEFAWFQLLDVLPGISSSAESIAKQVLKAAHNRRWELMPSWPAKIRMAAAVLFPELVGKSMGLINRLLPTGTSRAYKTGAQSRGLFDTAWMTKPFVMRAHQAEENWNQKPKDDPGFNMGLH